jgi:folate-binding protein YgfZ
MGKLAAQPPLQVALDELGIVAVRGVEARHFLQGQLSQDLQTLRDGQLLLAGYHTAQGRVLAVLRLCAQGHEDVLLILPRELAAPIATRLSKFLLRAKARIADESTLWSLHGHGGHAVGRYAWAERFVSVEPRGDSDASCAADAAVRWHASDIAAGLPQVYAASSELFVAQMLNLDLLNGVAFDKGCYTGQEIIARAHYRGRVKRRMQRFLTADSRALAPGARITLTDGRDARIVDALKRADGSQEFLAVATYGAADDEAAAAAEPVANSPRLSASPLPLPYGLPP